MFKRQTLLINHFGQHLFLIFYVLLCYLAFVMSTVRIIGELFELAKNKELNDWANWTNCVWLRKIC